MFLSCCVYISLVRRICIQRECEEMYQVELSDRTCHGTVDRDDLRFLPVYVGHSDQGSLFSLLFSLDISLIQESGGRRDETFFKTSRTKQRNARNVSPVTRIPRN